MTSQGSAYGRFRRALDTGNPAIALAAAAELDFVSLPDALEKVEPGDEQILESREQRELDALPSRLDRGRRG